MKENDLLREGFLAGDESALSEAGKAYGAYCMAIANAILRSRHDAEECVNDALLRAWKAAPEAKPVKLRPYIAQITRRLALDRAAEKKRLGRRAEALLSELADCIPSGSDTAGEAELNELTRRINGFINSLPETEANVFIRRCFYMESVKTIAEEYGLSPNHVSVMLGRTRKKLKKTLIDEGYIYE